MNKEQLISLQKEFNFQIDKKPSHGKNEVKALLTLCIANVFLNNTSWDKEEE